MADITGPKERCSYCERYTAHPHRIRIGRSDTFVICPACVQRSEQRYNALTSATAVIR